MRSREFFLAIVVIAGLVLGIFPQGADTRKLPENYVSDNCSSFPDGNYADCGVEHDKAYFFGGTKKERRAADNRLSECVRSKGHRFISKIMWVGVRTGGVGFLPTPFRWGFGKDWEKKHPVKGTKI